MAKSIFTIAAFALLASGCELLRNSIPSDVPAGMLTTDRALYEPGDDLVLSLVNTYPDRIGYNLCTSQMERERPSGGWESVQDNRVCTMELRTLEPGESATYTHTIPLDLASGTYRFIARIERMNGTDPQEAMQTIHSNPFRVQE